MEGSPVHIPDKVFFRIGDVADLVGVKPYVLRYWESEFPILSPEKSNKGQRIYKRSDVITLLLIKHLLYSERYSIDGARKRIRELRKEGQLKSYKEEKVLGIGQKAARAQSHQQAEKLAKELHSLVSVSIDEIFA